MVSPQASVWIAAIAARGASLVGAANERRNAIALSTSDDGGFRRAAPITPIAGSALTAMAARSAFTTAGTAGARAR